MGSPFQVNLSLEFLQKIKRDLIISTTTILGKPKTVYISSQKGHVLLYILCTEQLLGESFPS